MDFHLTLAVLLHYLAKSENPIYSCFRNNPFLFSWFFFIPPSLCPLNSLDLNPVDYAVWGILQERVYKHHMITDVEELRQRVEEEWDRLDQEVIDNAISEWCKRLTLHSNRRRTFWTFTLNITAFVHTLINMFWTLLTLLSVKQIMSSCTSNSLAVTVLWIFEFHKVV